MNDRATLNDLLAKRFVLKQRGRTRWMIIVQREIVAVATRLGEREVIANAWNYLSILLGEIRDHPAAEGAARNALWVYSSGENSKHELLGSYHMVLARILAAQGRYDEGIVEGMRALEMFAVTHHPPDEFLSCRIAEVQRMENHRDIIAATSGGH